MLCCLNPDCPNPHNPDDNKFCQTCSTPLVALRGHYRVIQLLSGEGGFGRTYLAEDTDKLNERCVVKQLAPQNQATWAIKKSIELFEQEARRLQQMGEHAQIPMMYAYFEENNFLYLVQQWIDGENLDYLARREGGWKESEVLDFLLDILPVVEFIHDRSIIHRDLKPSNIIRRRSDRKYVLIDFGASKQFLNVTVVTKGTQIGTLGYASSEQMQGGEAYPASDLFSLGAICFHLLSQTDPSDLFIKHGYDWVMNWRQYLQQPISDRMGKVIDKLLEPNRQLRYQSASEVLRDVNVKQPSPPDNKLKNPMLASGAILILGLGGFLYLLSHPFEFSFPSPPSQLAISQSPNTSLANFPAMTLTGHSDRVVSVAISPDGKILASGSADKTIKLWNLATGKEIRTLSGHSAYVRAIAITSDGKTLVSGSGDKTIKLWNLATGKEIGTFNELSTLIWSIAISPDGQTLISSSGSFVNGSDNTIELWNLATGQEIGTFLGHTSYISSVAISPDGQTLASGSWDKTIKLWNLITGQEIRTLKGHSDKVDSLAISPDGQTLASGSADNTIKLWDIATGEEIRTLTGHSGAINSVAISPDGQTLASGSADKTIKLWNLVTGEEIGTLKGHSDWVYSVAFSSDGQTLVSGGRDDTVRIWHLFL